MILSLYRKKRNPKETPEPFGSSIRNEELYFVIQKHAASHLHYDFRLQVKGVLKSWAIPKGPSLNPSEKHLAIMVEDHPLDYRQFEGIIPPGNYGAGTVMVWDQGTYIPLDNRKERITEKDFLKNIESGKISFYLKGQKLNGLFSLIRLKNSSGKENWLFIKANDEYASSENILDQETSVLSGRTLSEISQRTPVGKSQKKKQKFRL